MRVDNQRGRNRGSILIAGRATATLQWSQAPGKFYKGESQEKTLLQRPDFFLLPSPHD
jgi:hypothetical protein